MTSTKLKRSDNVSKLALAGCPEYKGRRIALMVHPEAPYAFRFSSNYWTDGHRSYYSLVSIRTGETARVPDSHPFFESAVSGQLEDAVIPPDTMIVEHQYFGTGQALKIHVRADNVQAMIEGRAS